MQTFEWVLLLLLAAVVLAGVARRIGAPYPALLALGGALLALFPSAPAPFTLDPQLVLALFVAPVLLDAAYDTSPRDLLQNARPVAGLVLGCIVLTTAAVAAVARALVPDLSWPAAVALGAMVAPPDAAAATAVLRQARPPHRIMVILEGESLLNDASALLIYRVAVAAALGAMPGAAQIVPLFALGVAGSLVLGYALARLTLALLPRVEDTPTSIVLQFISTFAVWIVAERLHLSGVLTVVAYGITLARRGPEQMPARLRVPSYAVWDVVVFMLNVLAFVLIGLQLRPIWDGLDAADRTRDLLMAGAVLATVIAARFAWIMGFIGFVRIGGGYRAGRETVLPTPGGGLIGSWCGMRGIVTLAAALALPDGSNGGPAFPHREQILLAAFAVVLGTLVIQGLTLQPLLRWLNLHDDDPVGREVAQARAAAHRAALASLDGDGSAEAERVRADYSHGVARAADEAPGLRRVGALRLRTLDAARATLLALRRQGAIGDAAFHIVEEELDRAVLSAEVDGRRGREG